jgi:hypothetical protein
VLPRFLAPVAVVVMDWSAVVGAVEGSGDGAPTEVSEAELVTWFSDMVADW